MPDPIVIDTNALEDRDFRYWLVSYRGRKILPMVCFVEFAVFLRSRGRSLGKIKGLIRSFGAEIEPFSQKHAQVAVETAILAGDFRKNWRDYMIAAHAHTAPLKLITYNTKDFQFLGRRVLTPQQARKNL